MSVASCRLRLRCAAGGANLLASPALAPRTLGPFAGTGRSCAAAAALPANFTEMLQQAANDRQDLKNQIKVQTELHKQRTEMLQNTLRGAEEERSELQEQVTHLNRDFAILSTKMHEDFVGFRNRIQRKGVKGRGAQSRMAYRPDIDTAEKQVTHVCEMPHQSLAELAVLGDHCARRERLLREIMAVDQVPWGKAHEVLNEISIFNEKYYWFETLPYRVGITVAFFGGIASILLVFWKPAAYWYGINIAGEELPEDVKDISEMTTMQVGAWTWSWMEPMIGVATFALLCCQFTRAQAAKMNMKLWSDFLLDWRGARIARKFPQYDGSILGAWGEYLPRVGFDFFPRYELHFKQKGPTSGL